MTLPLRRKRRTTVRRITPLTLAASAAAVLTLCVAPGFAQPPGYQPNNQPAANPQQPGALPLPPGYRPRTPPQPQPQRPAPVTPATVPGSGGSGKIMYFQKPADALVATGGPGSSEGAPVGSVAQVSEPARVPVAAVPDVPSFTLPPPPPQPRPFAPPADISYAQPEQPKVVDPEFPPTTSKKQGPIPPVPDEYIKLPPRESIFMVYDDSQLERAIMERLIQDRVKDFQDRIKQNKAQKKETADLEKNLAELLAIKDPAKDPSYRFPPLPVISPPGVAYQPKTPNYPPRQAILEPGYVVHRRLHFEERNAERQGWDLGPAQTLLSAAYFWRDAILLPQSVVSGCVQGAWDTNAGKCMPGSPSPYYLYPPGLTLTGTVAEATIITGGAFIFP